MLTPMEIELAAEVIALKDENAQSEARIKDLETKNVELKEGWARDKAHMLAQMQGLRGKFYRLRDHLASASSLRKDKKKKTHKIERKMARGDVDGAAMAEEERKEIAEALLEHEQECKDMIDEWKGDLKKYNDNAQAMKLSEQVEKQLHFA